MHPSILNLVCLSNPDGTIIGRNRFLPPTGIFTIEVDYGADFESLVVAARQKVVVPGLKEMFNPRFSTGKKIVSFELVRFQRTSKIEINSVLRELVRVGFVPACITELLIFVSKFREPLGLDRLVALGSSNEDYLNCLEQEKWLPRRITDFIFGESKTEISYPYIIGGECSSVEMVAGLDGKINAEFYFLAVHTRHAEDEKLVDFEISLAEYKATPKTLDLPDLDAVFASEEGSLFVARDGHLVQVVKGVDMFPGQWDPVRPRPERGLRHYRPVFK
jgi:hypothetical protein